MTATAAVPPVTGLLMYGESGSVIQDELLSDRPPVGAVIGLNLRSPVTKLVDRFGIYDSSFITSP